MTISYPVSMPAEPGISAIGFGGASAVAVQRSPFSFAEEVQVWSGQQWQVSVTVSPLVDRDLAEPWLAFLLSLNGREGTFLLGDPVATTPRGIATGTPVSASGGSPQVNEKGDRVIYTDGWTIGQTGILKAGDYIQIGSGASARLHKVLADANSDGSGRAALDIWPALRADVPDATAITTNAAKGVFRLTSNTMRWDVRDGIIYGVTFSAAEVV